MITTWEQYEKVIMLQNLCKEHGFILEKNRDGGYKIKVDNKRYYNFVEDNSIYFPENVDFAIVWIQGLLSSNWLKIMKESEKRECHTLKK